MPRVQANGFEVHYEEYGSGEPLLLIMGWGGNANTWTPQLPGLARHFRVITFDNRGAGRTTPPDEPFSIQDLAEDTVALLDALEETRVHVFGISMGGMIAQELALAHPERVSTLVLGCTSPGGSNAAGASELYSEIAEFRDTIAVEGPNLEWFAEFLQRLWTEEAIAKSDRNLQDFVFSIIRYPPTKHGLRWQADAIEDHDAFDRLHQISRPTLITTGADDALIDPDNSRLLADLIPHAELHIFEGLRHAFHLERPELVNSTIIEFIERSKSNGPAAH